MKREFTAATVGLTLLGATAAYAAVETTSKGVLENLDHGDWAIRFRGPGQPGEHICFDGGRQLIQIRHADLSCKSLVIKNSPEELIVQYTCPGKGYGRTNIRRETSRLIQIDSQGIAQGLPFAFAAEARRVGDCRS